MSYDDVFVYNIAAGYFWQELIQFLINVTNSKINF
jgi:hypothetical protein